MVYLPLGKFDSARDETLYYLAMGWMEDSFGDSGDYGLWVTAISISADDLDNEELKRIANETDDEMPLRELVGHFIVTENSQGFVSVLMYGDEAQRNKDLYSLQAQYEAWAAQDEDNA